CGICFPGAPGDERLPEVGAAYGEADEAGDCGGGGEPLADLGFVFSAAEDDAANFVAAVAAGCCDHLLAIFVAVEAFNLPDVGFDSCVLQFLDRSDHELRAE